MKQKKIILIAMIIVSVFLISVVASCDLFGETISAGITVKPL